MPLNEYRGPFIAQINITPFVDVMLVLLVIFMVTAPIIQQGVNVTLPQVAAGPLLNKDEQVVVVITGEGVIQCDGKTLTVEALHQKLIPILRSQPDYPVRLRADTHVPYGRVAEVMAVVRNAGGKRIGMVTEPLTKEEVR